VPYVLIAIAVVVAVFAPMLWVRYVMRRHSTEIPGMPGTGGELAMHLVRELDLQGVSVEMTEENRDHFDPTTKTVRLGPGNHDGKSLTAVAVAVHEVGHAIQYHRNEPLIRLRTRFAPYARLAERVGVSALMIMPVVLAVTRVPHAAGIMIAAGVASMLSAVVFHLLTLPVEWDASFNKALPILTGGRYIAPGEEKAVRSVLKAAAFTYVAAALADLLSLWRWLLILRR
jgi:Zn-dependent membrane protease YugP